MDRRAVYDEMEVEGFVRRRSMESAAEDWGHGGVFTRGNGGNGDLLV